MSATRRLAQLAALSPLERRVLGQALLVLPIASAGVRLMGLRRTEALLERLARPGAKTTGLDARSLARLVAIAARYGPVRARCLPASLTLRSLLRRHGMDGRLRIGVRKHEGRFEAHAWIEHAGSTLGDTAHPDFAAFEANEAAVR